MVVLSVQSPPTSVAEKSELAAVELCARLGADLWIIPHLYHLPDDSPLWAELAGQQFDRIVLLSWLHPRPAQWVLQRHGVVPPRGLVAINLESLDAATLEAALRDEPRRPAGATMIRRDATVRPRWYPVVDEARCVACQHCLQFCLFGVYARDDQGKLVVQNPDQCKAGCPACSRICPEGAIMFPLHAKEPAIAGAPGLLMQPDTAARRMFYARTKRACPACGRIDHGKAPAPGAAACPECGGTLAPAEATAPAAPSPAAAQFDDLDALVDELDRSTKRRV